MEAGERVETILDLGWCRLTQVIGSSPPRVEVLIRAFRPGEPVVGNFMVTLGDLVERMSMIGLELTFDGEGWLWGSVEVDEGRERLMLIQQMLLSCPR